MSATLLGRAMRVELPADQKLVLIGLADCSNDVGEAWPTHATLARFAGVEVSEARAALRRLGEIGLVTSTTRGRNSNLYRIDIAALDKLAGGRP